MKRLLLVVALAALVLVPWRMPTIGPDGYWRDRSLLDLFAPPVEGSYRANIVKSVQRGTIDLSGLTTQTATITAVSTANTLLHHLGYTDTDVSAEPRYFFSRLALTNTTTVTATVGIAPSAGFVSFETVEFYPPTLTNVQRGTITLAGVTSNTATITAATLAKSSLDVLGFSTTSATGMYNTVTKLVLTNTTTVTATKGVNTDTVIASYQVGTWR